MEEKWKSRLKSVTLAVLLCLVLIFLPIWPVQTYYENVGTLRCDENLVINPDVIYGSDYELNFYSLATIIENDYIWFSGVSDSTHIEINVFAFGMVWPVLILLGCILVAAKHNRVGGKTNYRPEYNFQR